MYSQNEIRPVLERMRREREEFEATLEGQLHARARSYGGLLVTHDVLALLLRLNLSEAWSRHRGAEECVHALKVAASAVHITLVQPMLRATSGGASEPDKRNAPEAMS